jgi:hypothetical protein
MELQTNSLASAFGWLVFFFLGGLALYVYFAVTLMIIARKTKTPGAGMAWIPVLNLYLMCQIGRRPAWWMLLCFVPLINLFTLAMIWMSIAEMCGKPVWTGALVIIPFVGLIIPAYLALGAKSAPALTLGARNCQSCGTSIVADETFCRNCGDSAATVVAARRASTGQMVLTSAGTSFAVLLVFGVFGWFSLARVLAYTPPERKPPAMSERTAGTLTEFPVDTDKTAPLAPESIVAEDLQNAPKSASTASNKQTAKRLPPGVNREDLKRRGGTALTTTVYRRRPKVGQPTAPITPADEIYICVLRITPGQANAIAIDIVKATSGNRSGTRLQSPRGGVYVGSKIQTPQVLIYVLEKQSTDTLILIYSPTPAMNDAAIRLAGNVGNGEGLNDYPETQNALWTLPQQKPSDLVLVDFNTVTRAELGLSDSDLNSAGNDEETRKLFEYFSQFIPERATYARYQDSARRDWDVVIYDYDSTRKAWNTWLFLSWTVGLSGQSISLKHGDGIYADTGDGRALIFQKGPFLIVVLAPSATVTDKLISLGDGFQV